MGIKQKASNQFANMFICYVARWIWPRRIQLDWVKGREGETKLKWNNTYISTWLNLIVREQEAILTMGNTSIAAQTDGSVQNRCMYMAQQLKTVVCFGQDNITFFL
jgi:hypothetical protein